MLLLSLSPTEKLIPYLKCARKCKQ